MIRIVIHNKYRDTYRLWKKCIVTPLLLTKELQSDGLPSSITKYW